VSPPDAVVQAWDALADHWDDQPRHDALLGLVAQHGCFAWAASQYKTRGDDPIALRQLERVRKAAIATMFTTASKKPEQERLPFKSSFIVLLIVAILTGVGLIYLQFRQPHSTQSHAP